MKVLIKCGQGIGKPQEIVWGPQASNDRDTRMRLPPLWSRTWRESSMRRALCQDLRNSIKGFSPSIGILKGQSQGDTLTLFSFLFPPLLPGLPFGTTHLEAKSQGIPLMEFTWVVLLGHRVGWGNMELDLEG